MAQAIRTTATSGRTRANGQHITRSGLHTHPRHFRGRQHAAAIFVIVAVAVCGFRLFPNTDVTVLSNGETYQVSATFDPRSEGLGAADISLQPGDVVRYSGGDKYASLAIEHAQAVRIEADGLITEVRTHAETIEGALADAGISLEPEDRVYLDHHLATARGPLAASVAASSRAFVPISTDATSSAKLDNPVSVSIVRARELTFVVDGMPVDVRSSAPNVQSFLADMGMTVREGDLVQPALDTELSSGMTVRLANAKTVTVVIDGKVQILYTQAKTVADIFYLLGVGVGPDDVLSSPMETPVVTSMTVSLGRTIVTDEDVLAPVEPGVRYEQDPDLPAGQVRTIPGVAGQSKTKFRITYKGGVEQERVAIASPEIVLTPVPTRVLQGTKGNVVPRPVAVAAPAPTQAPAPPPAQAVVPPPADSVGAAGGRKVSVVATWYNESHGGKDPGDHGYGITYSGRQLTYGMCATDPNYIPLGSTLYVPGYGNCIAADIGGGIRGWHIDLAFPEANGIPDWGVRNVEITILD